MNSRIAFFKFEKETPGAIQYKEIADGKKLAVKDSVIGTLYLRKSAMNGTVPDLIHVKVDWE